MLSSLDEVWSTAGASPNAPPTRPTPLVASARAVEVVPTAGDECSSPEPPPPPWYELEHVWLIAGIVLGAALFTHLDRLHSRLRTLERRLQFLD